MSRPAVRHLPGDFGAVEVTGLALERQIAKPEADEWLQQLLWAHAVVCLRFGRKLDDEELRAVVAMVGERKIPIGYDGAGNAIRYGEDREVADRPGLFPHFHTDDSYVASPAATTVLHPRKLPKRGSGGDTCFIDMRAAYDLLEPDQRQALVGLHAVYASERLANVSHPVIRAHPVTDHASIYFDLDQATHVEGLSEEQGRELLQWLQDHAEQRAPRYSHAWKGGDVLIWDNAAVQHRAGDDSPVGEPRRFWRYMVAGPRPRPFGL